MSATRWLKFNAVGGGGIILQLVVLALMTGLLKIHYALATALAVETAIIHNYLWHERYTWADRKQTRLRWRFLKFNLTTGTFSIAGNIGMMSLLVAKLHLHYLVSNGISIAACSIANYLVSDRFVFEAGNYAETGTAPSTLIICKAASRPERIQSGTPMPR